MSIVPSLDVQGIKQSLWTATAEPLSDYPSLAGDARTDVVVVGAGFTGLSAALHMAEKGASVIVLDAMQPGQGASGRNGGQVIAGLKADLPELTQRFGQGVAERMVDFTQTSADVTFGLIDRHRIRCDAIQGGFVQGAHGTSALRAIDTKVSSLSRRGLPVEAWDARQVEQQLGNNFYRGAFYDPRGGTLNPLGLARGLARAAEGFGAKIYGDSAVLSIEQNSGQWHVKTAQGASVHADQVLIATNGYSDLTSFGLDILRTVVPFYSYQIATKPLSHNRLAALPASGRGVSEFRRVLSYYRVDPEGRFLMGARGRLNGGLDANAFALARKRLKQLYPDLAGEPLEYLWNGRVALTQDHLPILSEPTPGLKVAMGWNGRGVALTTSMGPVLADWILGNQTDEDLPMPVRPLRALPFYRLHRPVAGLLAGIKAFQDWRESQD